ncbi:MAG: methyltransferase [Microbacteriaceae bacterium]|nr:methyltransferase [Microbacteriaceae bacterium]
MDAVAVRALRSDLEAARFTVEHLTSLWGAEAEAALERGDRVAARRALADSDAPAAVLARLFVLGLDLPRADLDHALPSLGAAGAVALGLVHGGDPVAPARDLRPYSFIDAQGAGQWWIVSDPGELVTGGALRTDHVLGVGGATATLSGLSLPGPVGSALDLGTGCGIQAMHLARVATRVVATDISHRALETAELNVALNDISGVELRHGSLFAPVAGERFDRVLSNPPFVVTPRRPGVPAYEYRDGGAVGDAIVEQLVTGMAGHLEPGGIAQLLGNWEYRDGRDGLERVLAWCDTGGLDAWIIERERQDPAQYAETWIRDGGTRPGAPGYEELVDAWLDDFAARGVEGVGFGYLLLRRPSGERTLRRAERIGTPLGAEPGGLGAHLAAALAAHDAVTALDDAALLRLPMTVAPDVTEERSHWPGEEHPSVIVLRQGGGFRREVRAGTALAAVVGACDGELSTQAIVDAVAGLLEADPVALAAELAPQLRELLVGGLLSLPAGIQDPSRRPT